jgi:nicotinate-nucleotide pyrophosphorylase (carboxylating)
VNLEAIIGQDISAAFAEDIGQCDWTALLIPEAAYANARLLCREETVLAGIPWFEAAFRRLDPQVTFKWHRREGDRIAGATEVCEVAGNARALLTAERTALNFLQTLSAVAAKTRRYVDAVRGTKAEVVDTRKTLPGLRQAQKYAVRAGGGGNHRLGLYDAMLIKENHIAAAGGVTAAHKRARELAPPAVWIQIEVETLDQLREALAAGATMILLDNMSLAQMREAVAITAGRAKLEASGGITLETIRPIAETGVDRISIGSLTKDVEAADYSLRFVA